MAAPLREGGTALEPGTAVELFRAALHEGLFAPDASGQRFLVARRSATTETVPLEILVNPFK